MAWAGCSTTATARSSPGAPTWLGCWPSATRNSTTSWCSSSSSPSCSSSGWRSTRCSSARLRKRPEFDFSVILVTLGLAVFLDNLVLVIFGARTKSLPEFLSGSVKIGGFTISWQLIGDVHLRPGGRRGAVRLHGQDAYRHEHAGGGAGSDRGAHRRHPSVPGLRHHLRHLHACCAGPAASSWRHASS